VADGPQQPEQTEKCGQEGHNEATAEPTLHGEYLKATTATEAALADAIARRAGFPPGQMESHVLAAVTIAAERTAVQHWSRARSPRGPLVAVVRTAVHLAVRGMTAPSHTVA
jgi:hypothetical protein